MGFRLRIERGAAAGADRLFDLDAVIGRASSCDLVVDDPTASRRHARVYRQGSGYSLEDLGSSNGTKLNGRAAEKAVLSHGDAIAIGSAVLRFTDERGSAPEATAAPVDQSDTPILSGIVGTAQRSSMLLEAADLRTAGPRRIKRAAAMVAVAGAALALLLAALGAVARRGQRTAAPEPMTLGRAPIEESFGVGEGVTYARPEGKVFDLELHAPGRAMAILHFHSRDALPGQVKVSANGTMVGTLPADANPDRSQQILIRSDLLKPSERNKIAFESARDSTAKKWRIWNLWVEVLMLPEMPPDQLVREAYASFDRAQQNLEHRDVGAANRYLAWKDFRTSWLTLEAHPDPKPDLYARVWDRMQEAQQELDRLCARLMLEIHRAQQVKDWRAARTALDQVKLFFPGTDQACAYQAEQKRAELNP